jgi:hypothetical protein
VAAAGVIICAYLDVLADWTDGFLSPGKFASVLFDGVRNPFHSSPKQVESTPGATLERLEMALGLIDSAFQLHLAPRCSVLEKRRVT